MSRKSKSFSQLYDYLTRDKNSYSFSINTFSNSKDKANLVNEFMRNSKYLDRNSRGKNYLYHELLSLEENSLSLEKQKEILLDLAEKYLSVRAENHLSFGVVHEDKNNVHLHLMISANQIEGNNRIRLSKKEFSNIQKQIENYKNIKYKELNKTSLYQNKKEPSYEKNKEQEIKHRRNRKTKKEKIKEDLEMLLKKAASNSSLEKTLLNNGYELYSRAETFGVVFESKKYRLKTLGLEYLYKKKINEFETRKQREIRRDKNKKDRANTKEYFKER